MSKEEKMEELNHQCDIAEQLGDWWLVMKLTIKITKLKMEDD